MNTFRAVFLALFACLNLAIITAAQEPVKPPLSTRIVTATRQVTLFSGLERQLLEAVQKKDTAAIKALLTDDFSVRMPDADPLPVDDWLDSVMSKDFNLKSFAVRQVDAVDLRDAAIVKFDRVQQSTFKGQNDGGEFYVVDIWRKAGDSWKLSDRYVSLLSTTPFMPKGDVKPTGKR
jgi:ketosteroid isomerase-like protein